MLALQVVEHLGLFREFLLVDGQAAAMNRLRENEKEGMPFHPTFIGPGQA